MSESKTHKQKRAAYTARVEYLAIKAEVDKMIAQGHRVKAIFEEMIRNGRITISYSTFCEYVRGGGRRSQKGEHRSQNNIRPSRPQRPLTRPGSKPHSLSAPFVYDKDVDISELV